MERLEYGLGYQAG